jgi:hypothetical protein
MSFDLIAFLGDGPMSAAEARAHLDRLRERDEARCREVAAESALPRNRPRPPLDGFYDDLVRQYPDLDELPDDAHDRAPWSVGLLGPWDDHIDMCISWPSAREVARFATPLALSHGVHVLDPQLGVGNHAKPRKTGQLDLRTCQCLSVQVFALGFFRAAERRSLAACSASRRR